MTISLTGTVFKGKQLGRTIGPYSKHKKKEDYKLIPLNGVYVKSIINQKTVFE
jgi:FAD synthase